jgi:hypothetical protein
MIQPVSSLPGFDVNKVCFANVVSVLGSITGLPVFREKYGVPAEDGFQLDPAWQSAIGQAPTIGNIMCVFPLFHHQFRSNPYSIAVSLLLLGSKIDTVISELCRSRTSSCAPSFLSSSCESLSVLHC